MDDSMKIFGLYSLNIFALMFSVSEFNQYLRSIVLIVSIIYTIIQIYKVLRK